MGFPFPGRPTQPASKKVVRQSPGPGALAPSWRPLCPRKIFRCLSAVLSKPVGGSAVPSAVNSLTRGRRWTFWVFLEFKDVETLARLPFPSAPPPVTPWAAGAPCNTWNPVYSSPSAACHTKKGHQASIDAPHIPFLPFPIPLSFFISLRPLGSQSARLRTCWSLKHILSAPPMSFRVLSHTSPQTPEDVDTPWLSTIWNVSDGNTIPEPSGARELPRPSFQVPPTLLLPLPQVLATGHDVFTYQTPTGNPPAGHQTRPTFPSPFRNPHPAPHATALRGRDSDAPKRRRPRATAPSDEEWERHKPIIEDLYMTRNLSLPRTIKTMRDEHRFTAT
jgi:hypothetical protein